MSAVLSRWRSRLAVRRKLLATARGALKAHQTLANLARVKLRKTQVAYAQRVVARHSSGASEPAHQTVRSPNYSSREGCPPRVIVLHSTEGGYAGSIAWLCNPKAQASAHVVVSAKGESTRLVDDADKAWHVAQDNPFTLGVEQEGYAAQTSWPDAQLEATAAWVAYWAAKYDIPITHSTSHGVCLHSDLGAAGGGHHDPGPNYPLTSVLAKAKG